EFPTIYIKTIMEYTIFHPVYFTAIYKSVKLFYVGLPFDFSLWIVDRIKIRCKQNPFIRIFIWHILPTMKVCLKPCPVFRDSEFPYFPWNAPGHLLIMV